MYNFELVTWDRNLFNHMGFVVRTRKTSKAKILERARKEAKYADTYAHFFSMTL